MNKYAIYEAEKLKLLRTCKTSLEYEQKLKELCIKLKI